MNQRKWAKGKPCQIRVPGHCNFNPETSVLCHYRMAGVSGIGQKSPDCCGAIGCSTCHDIVDGRMKTDLTADERKILHLEGVIRTQVLWGREND